MLFRSASKYNQIESGWNFSPLPARLNPPTVVSVPRNIAVSYNFTDLLVNWNYPILNGQRDSYVVSYLVEMRIGADGFWEQRQSVGTSSATFRNISNNTYYVRVASVDVVGRTSRWVVSNPISITNYNAVAMFTSAYTSGFGLEF